MFDAQSCDLCHVAAIRCPNGEKGGHGPLNDQ
jgi:hypothetical protein